MLTDPIAASSNNSNAESRADAPVAKPPRLGNYAVIAEIASGGMATVYLGCRAGVDGAKVHVAIKCCHPHLKRDPVFVAMFLDEARMAARIHHPNVVATLEVSDADSLYFVMEYIEGASLADWLKRIPDPRISGFESLVLRVLVDALFGLHAAHEMRDTEGKPLNFVHRDVSPQNLLIGIDGVTRIADFGIAKAESRLTRTRTGQVKGKTGYMSPEQILGEPLDRRSDVYAAGVVLWEALTGRRLFDGDSDAAIINQVLNNAVPAPSTVSEVSPALDDLVLRALKFQADARYASARQFAEALQDSDLAVANAHDVGIAIEELFGSEIRERIDNASRVNPEAPSVASEPGKPTQTSEAKNARWRLIAFAVLAVGLVATLLMSLRHPQEKLRSAPVVSAAATLEATPPSVVASVAAEPTPASESPTAITSSPRPTRAPRLASATAAPLTSNASGQVHRDAPSATASPEPTSPRQHPKSKPSEFRPPDL